MRDCVRVILGCHCHVVYGDAFGGVMVLVCVIRVVLWCLVVMMSLQKLSNHQPFRSSWPTTKAKSMEPQVKPKATHKAKMKLVPEWWAELLREEECRLNCNHQRRTWAGSNQHRVRERCMDCNLIFVNEARAMPKALKAKVRLISNLAAAQERLREGGNNPKSGTGAHRC